MPLGDYLVGLGFLLVTLGAIGAATAVLLRRRLRALAGAPRAVAAGVLVTAGVLAVHLVPLALGVLSRVSAALAALLLLALVLRLARTPAGHPDPDPGSAAPEPIGRLAWLLAGAGLAAYVGCTLVWLRGIVAFPVGYGDAVNFHLPGVARWIQSGSLWQNDEFVPGFATGAYPSSGNVVELAAVLPWRNDAFLRLVDYPFLALLGASTYAAAREVRASRPAAVLFATVLAALPIVNSPASQVLPDPMMLATFAAGVAFLLRHARTGRGADLVVAGMALGISFGTKWYGISAVVVVLGVWAGTGLLFRRPVAAVARQSAALAGLVLAGGGIWLVRNLVETGSPLYPLRVAAFGVTLFDAPPDAVGERYSFTLAHYLGRGDIWREHILPDYTVAFGIGGLVLLVGLVLAGALALARRGAGRRAILALGVAAVGVAVAYLITPGTAQGVRDHPSPGLIGGNARSLVPALVLAAVAGAWAVRRLGRAGLLLEVLALAGLVDAVSRSYDLPRWRAGLFALAGAVLLAAGVRVHRQWRAPARPLRLAGALGAVVLAVVGGQLLQTRFNAHRYHGLDAAVEWVLGRAPAHHRIGLVGASSTAFLPPAYALFGPRLENQVTYIGPMNAGTLLDYTEEAGFRAALRRGRYDLLVVGQGGVLRPDGSFSGADATGRLLAWARASGYRPLARSRALTLLGAPARGAGA